MRGRIVRGVTDAPCGELTVIGVCIPWRMAHVSHGRKDAAPWQEHRKFLEALRGLLAAEDTAGPLLLAGDFNQTLPRTRASQELGELLQECLAGGRVLTAGHRSEVQLLDHVVLFNGDHLRDDAVNVCSASREGRRLSDHDLVEVRLGAPVS
jgi:endonuclease/exonuclease/phosphatase (EEP) superfamily protein YafD